MIKENIMIHYANVHMAGGGHLGTKIVWTPQVSHHFTKFVTYHANT